MKILDITTTENDSKWLTRNGDYVRTDRGTAIAKNVILSDYGGFKYAPQVAGRARLFLNSRTQAGSVIARAFRVAMLAAGFSRPVVDVTKFPDEINVNTDNVLE